MRLLVTVRVAVLLDADVAAARVALEVLDPALAGADLADHRRSPPSSHSWKVTVLRNLPTQSPPV